jgi:hypothetical protein
MAWRTIRGRKVNVKNGARHKVRVGFRSREFNEHIRLEREKAERRELRAQLKAIRAESKARAKATKLVGKERAKEERIRILRESEGGS